MASSYYDDRGNVVRLGRELGRGGEGSVSEVAGQPTMVAKIYRKSLDEKKSQKLLTMVRGTDDQLLNIAAWPVRTLHLTRLGPVNGFVMPKVMNFHELHVLHGPKSRIQHFPTAGWPFLIHTAANAARAFAAMHAHGHVVGDVSDRNLLVSDSATVKFIDCDSFQIRSGITTFLCEVGVPTHTAPELHGQSLKTAVRTENHDLFRLAVLVFQLLLMGRHPFSGIPLVPGDMPIEKAIGEYRFAYGPKAASREMKSPPAAAPLEILPSSLAAKFERAFSSQGAIIGRPKASEWVTGLDTLSRSLSQCHRDLGHSYYKELNSCPWCSLQSASGLVLFTAVVTPHHTVVTSGLPSVNIDNIINWIETATSPGPLPDLPVPASIKVSPSTSVLQASKEIRKRRWGSVGIAAGGLVLVAIAWSSSIFIVLLIVLVVWPLVHHTYRGESDHVKVARANARQEMDKAAVEWTALQERWKRSSPDQFVIRHNQLRQKANEYKNLAALRDIKLKDFQGTAHSRHLQRYLQSYSVASSRITGIGPARLATLSAHGVHTAADITPAVINIFGFGMIYANSLLGWRRNLEKQFIGTPHRGITQADIAEVDKEIAAKRRELINELQQGEAALKQLQGRIILERQVVQPLLDSSLHALRQAEVDLAAL